MCYIKLRFTHLLAYFTYKTRATHYNMYEAIELQCRTLKLVRYIE